MVAEDPKRKRLLRVGTSGWHYKHWSGPFYPETMAPGAYLDHYQRRLDVVEINNSFYMQPALESVRAWARQTPPQFLFAYKAHRFITHMKKLKDPNDPLDRLYGVVRGLGAKAAAILFQLPPGWKVNEERFEAFLRALSPHYRHVFEFRNETWINPRILSLLEEYQQGFCIFDMGGRETPHLVTSDLVYIRLHGPRAGYKGSYDDGALDAWATRLLGWRDDGRDVLCFFDNDDSGYAAVNAMALAARVNGALT